MRNVRKPRPLSDQQHRFAVLAGSGTMSRAEAAKRAGYSKRRAGVAAAELARRPDVRELIEKTRQRIASRIVDGVLESVEMLHADLKSKSKKLSRWAAKEFRSPQILKAAGLAKEQLEVADADGGMGLLVIEVGGGQADGERG